MCKTIHHYAHPHFYHRVLKGSLISKTGSPAASQQSLTPSTDSTTTPSPHDAVDIQNTRFSQTRERRRQQRQKQKEKETTNEQKVNNDDDDEKEDVATRLQRRLDKRKKESTPTPPPVVNATTTTTTTPPIPTPRKTTPPPPIPRRKSVGDLKKQFSVPLVQKELAPSFSTPTSDEGM